MSSQSKPSPENAGEPPAAPTITSLRVNYRMTDQMGVVYYGNYLEFFEIARTELLRSAGFTYDQMEKEGYLMPVIHAACDYLSPARYDDLLAIHTRIEKLTRIRVHFGYTVTRMNERKILCRGISHHAVTGPDGRPRRLTPEWLERIKGTGKM